MAFCNNLDKIVNFGDIEKKSSLNFNKPFILKMIKLRVKCIYSIFREKNKIALKKLKKVSNFLNFKIENFATPMFVNIFE